MGRRGPKPTSTELLAARGSRSVRTKKKAPEIDPCMPSCPDWLCDEAKQEWNRVAKILYDSGILTELDRGALAAYCQAYGRWVECEKKVDELGGPVKKNDKGKVSVNYAYWGAQSAYKAFLKAATEFGMTPSSRDRIRVEKPPKKSEFEEKFLKLAQLKTR